MILTPLPFNRMKSVKKEQILRKNKYIDTLYNNGKYITLSLYTLLLQINFAKSRFQSNRLYLHVYPQ